MLRVTLFEKRLNYEQLVKHIMLLIERNVFANLTEVGGFKWVPYRAMGPFPNGRGILGFKKRH
jgi:hypothetical protein